MYTSISGMINDLQRLALEQDAVLVDGRRRLAVRDRIDDKRRTAQRQAQQHRIEERVLLESKHTGETAVTKLDRPTILSKRLPASGNSALGASALIQAAPGLEFTLSGLNKLADPHYAANFNAFVRSTPGATRGILSSLVMPGRDLTTSIPVELFIVPLGIAIAWLEFGRFLALRRAPASTVIPSGRPDQAPQAA